MIRLGTTKELITRPLHFAILNENFQFFPSEETWDSLRQHLEYLFYYGLIDLLILSPIYVFLRSRFMPKAWLAPKVLILATPVGMPFQRNPSDRQKARRH